ncbi:sensor histidine kinase [Aquimarina sp. MAR_2010_214]|uniref:sensor histidine kinase n=1 Tax=Aquimarina sp. MAR_2010_214 TaxID=1250026 RepID=UPI000C70F7A9|nr:histidine kinase [Aquimarina sp. MAR_2010_214]
MKIKSIWFHIGFWIVYTAIFTIVGASYKGKYTEALTFELMNMPMRLIIVYFNYFVLLPKLLLQGKTAKYFAYTLLTLIISGFIQRIINYEILSTLHTDMVDSGIWLPYKFLQASMIIASPLIFIIGISVIWKVAELQKRAKTLENEKLQSELKYLKSQINPHFLFNTLNNIYGLTLESSKKAPELILKLSDFLSFSLYESSQRFILLEKEISLLNDFIDLEKSRFEDRVDVQVDIPEQIDSVSIPPLILVPFIENAFKHSLKNETKIAHIIVKLEVINGQLIYEVINSKPEDTVDDSSLKGIGLQNIKKRLDILYNDRYQLDIKDEERLYTIVLRITI